MADTEVLLSGIANQAELVASGEVSSRELVEASLAQIDRLEPELNAFRIVFAERARERADECDRRRAAGEHAPLLGVPIAIKDGVDVAGELTTHGTAAFDQPATADAEQVRRLYEAGAVLVGKTNLPELAIVGFTETEAWGITRNPWNHDHTPGGSSGGSAAAVASGMVGTASASDGAGSIRIPAANCGLFGLKPQRGRVSLAPLSEHWLGMSQNGCLSRRVIDTALWLDVTAGAAPGDADTPPPPRGSFTDAARQGPGKLRIAMSTEPVRAAAPPILDDRVVAGIESMAEVLRSLGHEVIERAPRYGSVGNAMVARYMGGVAEDVAVVPHPERLEPRTRGFGRLGRSIPGPLVRNAVKAEAKHASRINAIFDDVDVVLTPATGQPAVEIGRWAGRGAIRTLLGMSRVYPYTPVWNYTGQPAASVPAPVPDGELPVGAMFISPPNREDLLLSLAAQIEAETNWPDRIPPGVLA
jgi:amidase